MLTVRLFFASIESLTKCILPLSSSVIKGLSSVFHVSFVSHFYLEYSCRPPLEDPFTYFPEIILKPLFLICIVLAPTLVHEADLTAVMAESWFALCLEGFSTTTWAANHPLLLSAHSSNSHFLLECWDWGADE